MARWLETQEILTLEQLAGLDDDDVAELQAGLAAFPGRIVQQRWVEQARKLIAGPTESP
jgi:predicted flap endonuclease-1-like 5' DNA nuclease